MRHSGFYGFMWTDTRSGQLVNPSSILWSLACLFESTKLGKVCCAVGIPEYTEEPILGIWVPGRRPAVRLPGRIYKRVVQYNRVI